MVNLQSPLAILVTFVLCLYALAPRTVLFLGSLHGRWILSRTGQRRESVVARTNEAQTGSAVSENKDANSSDEEWEKVDRNSKAAINAASDLQSGNSDWDGIVGFFHPFCNAGGGGERVLWGAIYATQKRWPKAICAVYTGDQDVTKDQVIGRVKNSFNIQLNPTTIIFIYLSTRDYVLSSTWPHFTLLGQSLGSLVLAYDAFTLLVPDILVDTMGYAFAFALCRFLFPSIPVGAYVHYPTISTDMLGSLDAEVASGRGIHAGLGKGWRGEAKRNYWHLFAWLYGKVGGAADVVMTNSTWTCAHIQQLWGPTRASRKKQYPIEIVYPPCAVEEFQRRIPITLETEKIRRPVLLCIAQFRPEKNHGLVLRSFAKMLKDRGVRSTLASVSPTATPNRLAATAAANNASLDDKPLPHLLLIGSVRNATDETYIYSLRLLAHELHITSHTTFLLNAPWSTVLEYLRTASIGVNCMWNEHFGIGVVEYQAAGLISVVNDSGGPKLDIVRDTGIHGTGFTASSEEEYAAAFGKVIDLAENEKVGMRMRARASAQRFSDSTFETKWIENFGKLVDLAVARRRRR